METTSLYIDGPRYGYNALKNDEKNEQILKRNLQAYDKIDKARVGDFLLLPDGRVTRFTHDWGDHIQTGGSPGNAYYFGEGYMSYSGGLNHGIKHEFLELTNEKMKGSVWFFSCGYAGASCGVYYTVLFRVYKIKENTPPKELSGLCLDSTSEYSGNYKVN